MATIINLARFKAVIFDMDGTMIDNAAYHKEAWRFFLQQHDIIMTDEQFQTQIAGRKNDQIISNVFNDTLSGEKSTAYGKQKEALYRDLYATEIAEVPGLTTVVAALESHGLKTAIATTANKENRVFALKELRLEDQFEVILGEEHVTHDKPNPEIYLSTAEKLGVDPENCIVFEDTSSGVAAAKSAGMTVVGILSSHSPEELSAADYTVHNFTELQFS